jgi:hypothetical protein
MLHPNRLLLVSLAFILIFSSCNPSPPVESPTAPTAPPIASTPTGEIPYGLISARRMLSHLEVLTNIQAYSGYRTAATLGEAEAFDYVAAQLERMAGLETMGLEIERQSFDVFITTEIHQAQVFFTGADGREVEVPASGLRGSRYRPWHAIYFDSDGSLGDLSSDPLSASGEPILIHSLLQLRQLDDLDVTGRILIADPTLFDALLGGSYDVNRTKLIEAIERGAAGLILLSRYSNAVDRSHGSFVNEGAFLQNLVPESKIPILALRLEDLTPAGIDSWTDMKALTTVRLLVDSDVIQSAPSGNLVARIPGKDTSQAVILTAHLDSPNTPGGFDDGSGSVILLEMAEVLNESGLQPDVDLYLVWNGSHENGIYGSAYFAETHGELLDRTLAELTIDCLGMPLKGNFSDITLYYNSFARFGNGSARWQNYLANRVSDRGIPIVLLDTHGLIADNSNFDTWNVPEADLMYFMGSDMAARGTYYTHYANHWHDSYETVDVVEQVSDILKQMASVTLTAAIQTGREAPKLRTVIASERRALFVGSHNQPASMMTSLRELGMALAMKGFDVDPLPYGRPVTPADLENAGIVVLLPTYDWPGDQDPGWSPAELEALEAYVDAGGLLVVTNSQYAHIMTLLGFEPNEDRLDLNGFLQPFGVAFQEATYSAAEAEAAAEHVLTDKAGTLLTYGDAGVTFTLKSGEVLYTSDGLPIVALIEHGENGGQLLVIGDLGLLIDNGNSGDNLQFLKNLAAFAQDR